MNDTRSNADSAEAHLDGIGLIEGERIESTLDLAGDEDRNHSDVMLLTDSRVILINSRRRRSKTIFASIHDIDVVEVVFEQQGYGPYVWAGIAFIVAIALYGIIDNTIGSLVAAGVVALMGVYLIADHLLTPGRPTVAFKTTSSHLQFDLESDEVPEEVYAFINRLFQLRNGVGPRGRRFIPR